MAQYKNSCDTITKLLKKDMYQIHPIVSRILYLWIYELSYYILNDREKQNHFPCLPSRLLKFFAFFSIKVDLWPTPILLKFLPLLLPKWLPLFCPNFCLFLAPKLIHEYPLFFLIFYLFLAPKLIHDYLLFCSIFFVFL